MEVRSKGDGDSDGLDSKGTNGDDLDSKGMEVRSNGDGDGDGG